MEKPIFCLGGLPRIVRCESNKIWTCSKIQKRRKSNFDDFHKTQKSMLLPDKNKEQYELYKVLVHDFKPIDFASSNKPQEIMPQTLNKEVKAIHGHTGTQSGDINAKRKKNVLLNKNKNMITNLKKLQRKDNVHENLSVPQSEERVHNTIKSLLINTIGGTLKPQSKPSGMTESYEVKTKPEFKANVVKEREFSPSSYGKKEYVHMKDADLEKKMPFTVLGKPNRQISPVDTIIMGDLKPQSKASKIKNIYGVTVELCKISSTLSDKEGVTLYDIAEQIESLSRDVLEKPRKDNSSIEPRAKRYRNIGGKEFSLHKDADQEECFPCDVLEEPRKNTYLTQPSTKTYQCSSCNIGGEGFSLYEDGDQEESFPCVVLKEPCKDNSLIQPRSQKYQCSLTQPSAKTYQCSSSKISGEGFSLYDDADQDESLPRDVLEEPRKQSMRLKETASLMSLVQSVRERSRADYFDACMDSVVTTKNLSRFLPLGSPPIMFPLPPLESVVTEITEKKLSHFPPLGPPPLMFRPAPSALPLPVSSKRKKNNKK